MTVYGMPRWKRRHQMQKCTKSNHVYPGQLEGKSIVEANTVSSYLKRSLYLLFLDHLIKELDEQLVKPLPGFQAQLLIPGKLYIYISNKKAAGKGDSQRTEQRNEAVGLKATYVVYPTDGREITAPML